MEGMLIVSIKPKLAGTQCDNMKVGLEIGHCQSVMEWCFRVSQISGHMPIFKIVTA